MVSPGLPTLGDIGGRTCTLTSLAKHVASPRTNLDIFWAVESSAWTFLIFGRTMGFTHIVITCWSVKPFSKFSVHNFYQCLPSAEFPSSLHVVKKGMLQQIFQGKHVFFFASFCELAGRMTQIIVTIGQLIQSFSLQLSWSTTQLNMDFGDWNILKHIETYWNHS